MTALACQADLNGVFEDNRHLGGLTEKLHHGDTGRGREAIRATIENSMVGEDGPLTLDVKPQGLLGARTAIAHSGCRGNGPIMERTIQSVTGRQWKVIRTGQGAGGLEPIMEQWITFPAGRPWRITSTAAV